MNARTLLAGAAAAVLLATAPAAADWKPPGPLNLQIGFGAGGETDTIGRVIAAALEEETGWNVIAENKPGGGGIAMFTGIAVAPADGSVIGMGVNMPVMINLLLRGDQLPFDLDSFDYLATVARAPLSIIARADAPYDDVKGLVAWAKEQGGAPVAFDAKPQELIFQGIEKQTSAGLRLVSTKSSAEMLQLVLGGQVSASFSAGTHIPYLESGQVKMLASANSERHDYALATATLLEQGYGLFSDPWFYFAGPSGMPDEARAALATALDRALKTEQVRRVVANTLSTEPRNLGPNETRAMFDRGMEGVAVLFAE